MNNAVTASVLGMRFSSFHQNMGDEILASDGIAVVVGEWWATSTAENNTAQTTTEYMAIEYPLGADGSAGIFTIATWNGGQTSTTCAPGTNVVTDFIKLPRSMPRGAAFRIHRYVQMPVAAPIPVWVASTNPCNLFVSSYAPSTAMATQAGAGNTLTPPYNVHNWPIFPCEFQCAYASGLPVGVNPLQLITTSVIPASGFTQTYTVAAVSGPLAVLGKSSIPSVIGYGDSKMAGTQDNYNTWADPYYGMGDAFRGIGQFYPYCNCGVPSDTIAKFATTSLLRQALAQYHTNVHIEYGINDVIAGASAATIQANLTTAYGFFSSLKVSQQTIEPRSSSSDSWATVANQTTGANNAARTTVNDWIRGLPSPLTQYFEIADVVENGRNAGVWKGTDSSPTPFPAMTGDGIHPTPYGYHYIRNFGPFIAGCFG